MPERILAFGGGGFIGSALVAALVRGGHLVVSVGRTRPVLRIPGVEYVAVGDPEPRQLESILARSDAVIHLASGSTPGSTAGKPLSEIGANLSPTLALLDAMQTVPGLPLLYISSAGSLYGERGQGAFGERDPIVPRSYHGAAKAAIEHFIGAYCRQFGGRATILRPSNVYGPGQPARPGFGIVPHALAALRSGEPLTVWGDGSIARDYLYVDDLVALCIAVLMQDMPSGTRTFNAGSGVAVSLNDLFVLMEKVTGRRLNRVYDRARSVDASRVAVDSEQASAVYGWQPVVSLEEGLGRTWKWLQSTTR